LKAWLTLYPDGRYALKPQDQEQSGELFLEAYEDPDHPILRPAIKDILDELRNMSIPVFDVDAILSEINHPTCHPVLIARGKESLPGKDAYLEIFFKEQIESAYEEINGAIDFRNHLKIPSVKKDEMVARKIPVTPSVRGNDVFGNPIETPKPKDVVLVAKKNVKINANHEVFALKEGRPRITGGIIKFIDITTSHVITGDVDMKTGNIVFSGDIVIYGDIADGMIVEALGDITIMGNIYRATVTATGSIRVLGNTIGSKLYSGHYGVLFNRLYSHSSKLNDQLKSFSSSAAQLIKLASDRGHAVSERQVYQLLLESKFSDLPGIANQILVCISNIQNLKSDQLSDLKDKLQPLLSPPYLPHTEEAVYIQNLQLMLGETIESIRRSEEADVCTDLQQCHMTEILSNGDIRIRKQGVLQSTLYSKGNIVFYESDSVCRGSNLEAGGIISAMIVGGVSGGRTSLKAGRKVITSLIYEGRVTVDRFGKDIIEPMEKACFFVKNNRLVVETNSEQAGVEDRVIS
jgi:hypothetical protein